MHLSRPFVSSAVCLATAVRKNGLKRYKGADGVAATASRSTNEDDRERSLPERDGGKIAEMRFLKKKNLRACAYPVRERRKSLRRPDFVCGKGSQELVRDSVKKRRRKRSSRPIDAHALHCFGQTFIRTHLSATRQTMTLARDK